MTIQTLDKIMERIAEATQESPLAVFKVRQSPAKFDAIPANTVAAQWRMTDASYIGSFCGHDYSGEIEAMIVDACCDV